MRLCFISFLSLFAIFPFSAFSQIESRKILLGKMSLMMPIDFKIMDEKVLAFKYSSANKPSEVYTNEEATVNIAFKKTEQLLAEQNVVTEGKKLELQLINKGKVILIGSEQIKSNGNNIHVFSFYSNAIDTKVYNVMFVFSLKGEMVVGSFNCTIALQNQWQSIAFEIIRSIKEI